MKYNTAKVISHPRAGSHYFAQLLNVNFFNKDSYLELYAGHSDHHKNWLNNPNTAVFYIYRNNEDTIKSMFNMRNRLGLVADNIKVFKSSTLKSMHNKNIKSETIRNVAGNKELITEVDTFLAGYDQTPEEFLNSHKRKWLKLANSNFYAVSYDVLKIEFKYEMLMIAKFLGSDKTEFTQEYNRIGWYDKNEPEKNFS